MVSFSELSSVGKGKVWLVGAGPGAPDLLTVKALRVLQGAGLILFDHLVSEEIRALFTRMVPSPAIIVIGRVVSFASRTSDVRAEVQAGLRTQAVAMGREFDRSLAG